MITSTDLVRISHKAYSGAGAVIARETGEAWIAEYGAAGYRERDFELLRVDTCLVCGSPDVDQRTAPEFRCCRHVGRHACLVEGCRRSRTAQSQPARDRWVCAEHWRRYVPARSLRRRSYHAIFRRAKRYGWTADLEARYWRFWDRLVRDVRRRSTEGSLDTSAIDRLFGLNDPQG